MKIETEISNVTGKSLAIETKTNHRTFYIYSNDNSEELLQKVKDLLLIVLRQNVAGKISDEQWSEILPKWFVDKCKSKEDSRLHWLEEGYLEEVWTVNEWIYWMQPNQRTWFWLTGNNINDTVCAVSIEVLGEQYLPESFCWMFLASGAIDIIDNYAQSRIIYIEPRVEIHRLMHGPDSQDEIRGLEFPISFFVHCDNNALQVLGKVKQILHIVLLNTNEIFPTDREWSELFPLWFIQAFSIRSMESEFDSQWSLDEWIYWFRPEQRNWFWWDVKIINDNLFEVLVEVEDDPFSWGSLWWLLHASGGIKVNHGVDEFKLC